MQAMPDVAGSLKDVASAQASGLNIGTLMYTQIKHAISKIADRKKKHASYVRVFESPDGKVVLADLLQRAGITRMKTDEDLKINYGERRLVYWILSEINLDPQVIEQQLEQIQQPTYEEVEFRSDS